MKLKDYFTKLKEQGKITQPEYVSFLETVPEGEIPDKVFEAIEAAFLTIDRAVTDKAVNSKIRREVLDPVDKELNELIDYHLKDYVHQDKRESFKKEESTYNKIKSLSGVLGESFKRVQVPSTDEEIKKKMKTVEQTNQELLQRIEKINTEYASKEKTIASDADKKINNYRKRIELEKLANSFKFGKAYEEEAARRKLTKVTLDDLEVRHNLQLVDTNGQTVIQVQDKEGQPLFNGNSAVTVQQLLEEEFKPFIKANNSGDDDLGEGNQDQDIKRFHVPDGQPKIRQGARTTVQ